ncbi:MAG: FAD-binding oxidoreductase [Oscillatoriales cyanobacterium SM2_2_1]|nr:FAD-binding oxidoreductase [Oscillatoriales cyanobacterium SM2_2_1]
MPDAPQLLHQIPDLDVITAPAQLAKLSLDYFHFSPILEPQLREKRADVVVRPTTEPQFYQIAAIARQTQTPITVRGSGTGNYGQCIPLQGGIIVDLSNYNEILWIHDGIARVQAGVKLAELERQSRPMGWEWRMVPSTVRSATIGGFIAGGSGGIGSVRYGQLRDRGNLHAVKVLTLEEEPRIMELRGYDAVQQVVHAYGTNGIILELEVPLAPAITWLEWVVSFADFWHAVHFAQTLGKSDGIQTRLISVHADPIPTFFTPLRSHLSPGHAAVLLILAVSDQEAVIDLIEQFGGWCSFTQTAPAPGKGGSLMEFSWNHTTLHARSADAQWTYLQSLFPADPEFRVMRQMAEMFGDEVPLHLEFIRQNGTLIPAAIQLVRFTTGDRLQEIIAIHEAHGVLIANPHTYLLEAGGMKTVDRAQLQFKRLVDPQGLMNPGKMAAWND